MSEYRRRTPSPFPDDLRASFISDALATHDGCPDIPTKIDKPFWKYMVSSDGMTAYIARHKFRFPMRSWERRERRAVFSFSRFGRTETMLPDGRLVYIGGVHEVFYDDDYFIYNDVVVVRGHSDGREKAEAKLDARFAKFPEYPRSSVDRMKSFHIEGFLTHATAVEEAIPDEIDMYGYPTDIFPPTDHHTATYHKDENSGKEYIYIIGGSGYKGGPHREATLTHRLDLQDFSIQRMETTGEKPPPGFKREARKDGDTIVYATEESDYMLSLTDMGWSKTQWEYSPGLSSEPGEPCKRQCQVI
jgi:hypothetical protein